MWDPTAEGRAKLMAHWGRFYESVPMDINVRAFGGEITDFSTTGCTALNNRDDVTQEELDACDTYRAGNFQLGDGAEFVAPSLKGQYTDELILGGEYEVMADFKMGVNFVTRNMPRVIEDSSTDGGAHYLIVNPGEDFSADATDLRTEATGLMTSNPELAALLNARADVLDKISTFDKPIRDYQAVQITAQQRFAKNAMLLASYTYSRSVGNYPGLFSTETGQLDPNLTSLYDLQDMKKDGLLNAFASTEGSIDHYLALLPPKGGIPQSAMLIETSTASTTIASVVSGQLTPAEAGVDFDASVVDKANIVPGSPPGATGRASPRPPAGRWRCSRCFG